LAEKPTKTEIKKPNAIVRYYRETVGELRKVNWPTWPEASNLTVIVLVVLGVMMIYLGGLDYLGGLLVRLMLGVI